MLEIPTYEGDINEELPCPPGFLNRTPENEPTDMKFQLGTDDTLVITFGGCGLGLDGEAQYAYDNLLRFSTHSKLLVRDQFQCWYHNGVRGVSTDIDSTVEALRAETEGFNTVVTAGTSAGGYAAILFGVLLGADRVLAINPQTLLQRGVQCIAHGNLYRLKWCPSTPLVDLLRLPPSDCDINILYGYDDKVDVFHSGRMRMRSDVTLLSRPGVHGTVAHMARDRGELAEFFEI